MQCHRNPHPIRRNWQLNALSPKYSEILLRFFSWSQRPTRKRIRRSWRLQLWSVLLVRNDTQRGNRRLLALRGRPPILAIHSSCRESTAIMTKQLAEGAILYKQFYKWFFILRKIILLDRNKLERGEAQLPPPSPPPHRMNRMSTGVGLDQHGLSSQIFPHVIDLLYFFRASVM